MDSDRNSYMLQEVFSDVPQNTQKLQSEFFREKIKKDCVQKCESFV